MAASGKGNSEGLWISENWCGRGRATFQLNSTTDWLHPWTSYLISLCFSFLVCNLGIDCRRSSEDFLKGNSGKSLSITLST